MTTNEKNTKVVDLFSGIAHAEKYQSGNWIAQQLVNNFMKSILSTAQQTGSTEVHEIGCGEGHILGILATNNFKVRGCDIAEESLAVARSESAKRSLDIPLQIRSIYDLNPVHDSAEIVLCCEVLEHLTEPEEGFKKLVQITQKT